MSDEVAPATPAQKRQLRLKGLWANYVEAQDKLVALLHEARDNDDYKDLGYASWTAYVADTFGAEPTIRLAREQRQELVQLLAAEGMSTRAIAPVVGVGKSTVADDLAAVRNRTPDTQSGENAVAPIPKKKNYSAKRAAIAAHHEQELQAKNAKKTVGLDGKEYRSRPNAKPDRARRAPKSMTESEAREITAQVKATADELFLSGIALGYTLAQLKYSGRHLQSLGYATFDDCLDALLRHRCPDEQIAAVKEIFADEPITPIPAEVVEP